MPAILSSSSRFGAGDGEAVCGRGRVCIHHRPTKGQVGRGSQDDWPECDRCAGRCVEPCRSDRLYETVKKEKGNIDVLFASAGYGEFAKIGEVTEEHFDKTFGLNVRGTLFTVQKALSLFADRGSIFLNESIASIKGFPAFSVYSASKAALRSFARTWLVDLKERKIRVNILSPGTIDTPILDPLGPEAKEYFKTLIPRGEIGRPEEIATVALFLASSDSSFVNGVELFVGWRYSTDLT
jgi:NAD(P)-dependent dehydrogenase (short-subunit alcohol dehydrogenase family)